MKSILLPLALLALATASSAQGPVTYRYSHDLSSLALATPGLTSADREMYLDLQLSDGSQLGNGTTTVTLSNFELTGGTFGAALGDIGGVARLSDGRIILRDTASSINGLADAAIAFMIPTGAVMPRLEFDFQITATGFDTPSDYFAVTLLVASLSPITTDGNVGSESLGVRVSSNELSPESFTATPEYAVERAANGDSRFLTLARPTATVTAVPEPATMAILGLGGLALLRRQKRA